jgi:hypothetical protein
MIHRCVVQRPERHVDAVMPQDHVKRRWSTSARPLKRDIGPVEILESGYRSGDPPNHPWTARSIREEPNEGPRERPTDFFQHHLYTS